MIRKILWLLICLITVKTAVAQNMLVTHRTIRQQVFAGVFMQKMGTVIPDDDACINVTEAKNLLYLNESVLPTNGRMPWNTELVPLRTIPCTGGSPVCATTFLSYSACGSFIYGTGYNTTLTTFTRTQIPSSNAFWMGDGAQCKLAIPLSNVTGAPTVSPTTPGTIPFPGPLNRCGIWPNCNGATSPVNLWVRIDRTITAPTSKTYYIGIAADNAFRVIIDGVLRFQLVTDKLPIVYRVWHILPITLTAGTHSINIDALDQGAPGVMGAEIYDNTAAQITAATSYAGLNLIFSTRDVVGESVCTVPVPACNGEGQKVINGVCEQATVTCTSVRSGNLWQNTYQYTWSDKSTLKVTKTESFNCLA